LCCADNNFAATTTVAAIGNSNLLTCSNSSRWPTSKCPRPRHCHRRQQQLQQLQQKQRPCPCPGHACWDQIDCQTVAKVVAVAAVAAVAVVVVVVASVVVGAYLIMFSSNYTL